MITVRASDAYKIYSNKYSTSPNYNLIYWDNYLKELFTFDGVKYSVTSQYYNRINNFINIHYRYAQPHALAYASTEHVGIFTDNYFERALNFSIKKIGWGFSHETGHMMDIREREFPEITNNMVSKYYDAVICGNNTAGINDHQKNKIKYMTENNIDEKTRGCELVNNKDCMGFLKNSKLNYLIWWDLESIHHGYWGELDNMYRYNNTLPSRITKEEKMVYFSSIIFGMNLGYYFTRWGLSFKYSNNIFDEKNVTNEYKDLLDEAIKKGLISIVAPKRKFWYVDNDQYKLNSNITGCYYDKTKYNVQISKVIKQENKYQIIISKTECPYHLGFEVYETNKLIGFTYQNIYIDETKYKTGYTPKYKIIAYDRALYYSKESDYKSAPSSSALKFLNYNHILNE